MFAPPAHPLKVYAAPRATSAVVPRRRAFLATAGAAVGAALAGCLDGLASRSCVPVEPQSAIAVQRADVSLPVPKSALLEAASRDDIRAITDPAFGPDWDDLDERLGRSTGQRLVPDDLVIGVERAGRARAYPLQVLWTHEVVNDDLAGPLIATYCPVCGSSVTAERTVNGRATTFGVSGYLWRADLVMYDRLTDSLWSQIMATAIRGPAVGESLPLVPSTLTTWSAWRSEHPGTDVLLPPPVSTALGEATEQPYYFPYRQHQVFHDRAGDAFEARTAVKGVVVNGEARAYPFPALDRERVINDRLGGHPVLVALGSGDRVVAYDRCVEGRPLEFEPAGVGVANAGSSRWQLDTGLALDGPHEGSRLGGLAGPPPMFWFAWRDFFPDSDVYGDVVPPSPTSR